MLAAWGGLIVYKPHGPLKSISRLLSRRLTAWQILVLAYMVEYLRRNFARIVGLHSPEPLANKYNRDYFRATWVTTALDAGFWTAMRLKPKWLRDAASVVFSVYYLFAAEAADDKVRKVRGVIGVDHMRVSWNKGTTPYIAALGRLMRPRRLNIKYKPRQIRIPRPKGSTYTEPIRAWLYFDGPLGDLQHHDKIILDVPGGGFVAMDPRCHDDKLIAWAAKTGFPVISLDYKKAPEYPYPYALNECFDIYYQIHATGGTCVGFPNPIRPKVVVSGDSAGGNLATGLVLMLVQQRIEPTASRMAFDVHHLPLPEALVLIYPALDVNITSWLTDEQSALIEEPARRKYNRGLMRRQTEDYHRLANTPLPSEDDMEAAGLTMTKRDRSRSPKEKDGHAGEKDRAVSSRKERLYDPDKNLTHANGSTKKSNISKPKTVSPPKPRPLRTKIKTTSMISYVDDRILTPELLRGMIFLYIGEASRPDFATDFFLSPLRAPEHYLREFPKVYLLTGEKDPLCDDTAIFAGRLRAAHKGAFQTRKDLGIVPEREEFDDSKLLHVEFIPGVSHGFLQFASVYEPAWGFIEMCSRWMKQAFVEGEEARASTQKRKDKTSHHARTSPQSSGDRESGSDYFSQNRHPSKMQTSDDAVHSTDTSDNEDLALEMTTLSQLHIPRHHERRGSGGTGGSGRETIAGGGKRRSRHGVRKHYLDGRMSPVETRKGMNMQNLRLTNPETLLERRMGGVATGLMGDDSRPVTPT